MRPVAHERTRPGVVGNGLPSYLSIVSISRSSCSRSIVPPSSRRTHARWPYFSSQVRTASASLCSCTPRWRSPVHASGSDAAELGVPEQRRHVVQRDAIPTWLIGLLVMVWIARSASERPRNSQMSPVARGGDGLVEGQRRVGHRR